jgi:hypothetical protein
MKSKWSEYFRVIAFISVPTAIVSGVLVAFVYTWDYYYYVSPLLRVLVVNGLAVWLASGNAYIFLKKKYPWYIYLLTLVLWLAVGYVCAAVASSYLLQTS